MKTLKGHQQEDDLPVKLSQPAQRALAGAGIKVQPGRDQAITRHRAKCARSTATGPGHKRSVVR